VYQVTRTIHIPRKSLATGVVLWLMTTLLVWTGALPAAAQTTEPDTVCLGVTEPYWVNPSPGSTYHWELDGAPQTPTPGTDSVIITWNATGDFILTVQETSAANCLGPVDTLKIHVIHDPPLFVPPALSAGYCPEDITSAVYQPGGTYYVNDLVPPRPDYYFLPQGSTLLDYTLQPQSCPGGLTVTWEIDFEGALPPNLTGTGQISAAIPASGIQFPIGNNVITWTVTDIAGNTMTYSVTLVVLPRPDIGDIPP